jgi:EAL domain-containing protein (putative c-di-GMP-specific phosphodiesterase class I)
VDRSRNQVVGFEALARGPQGPLRSPAQLFKAARRRGRLGELDWVCRATAFRAMLNADLPRSLSLFVNVEADSLIEACPDDLLPTIVEAESRLRVFIDIAGPTLTRYPSQVLETVRRARAAGWGVALDDLEFSPAGVAMLPTIEPDVIKLDQHTLSGGLVHAGSPVLAALAEKERTNASLLVKRVESEAEATIAQAYGLRYLQGRLLGREGPLPKSVPVPNAPLPIVHQDLADGPKSPYEVLTQHGGRPSTDINQASLDSLIRAGAVEVCSTDRPQVVASISPTGTVTPPETLHMFRILLERSPLIIVLGPDVSEWNDWRVRASDVPAGHPLGSECCFATLSPTGALAIAGHRRSAANDPYPTWTVALSQDPALCREVFRHLVATVDTLAGGVFGDHA